MFSMYPSPVLASSTSVANPFSDVAPKAPQNLLFKLREQNLKLAELARPNAMAQDFAHIFQLATAKGALDLSPRGRQGALYSSMRGIL